MPTFRPLPEYELEPRSDDALIAYVRDAGAAGQPQAGQRALAILVFGHWSNVERAVRLKIPTEYVEEVTADIIESAIRSAFDGQSVGEFVNWLKRIRQRRVADFYSRGPGAQPAAVPIGPRDDDDAPGGAPEPAVSDDTGYVEVQDIVERTMAKLSDRDRRAVDVLIFEDRSAQDAVEEIAGLSVDNANQIKSRFRRTLRGELDT